MLQISLINDDVKNTTNMFNSDEFDIITCNPPYFKVFDESKLEDPSLIIYAPVRVIDGKTIVTNGDQTDTIFDGLKNGLTFEQSLRSRKYEHDAPNYTPRISSLLELENGKCDVVVIDSATAQKYVKDNANLKIVEDSDAFEAEEYAIAVKKGNADLLNSVNAAIDKMLADGTISELAAKYTDATFVVDNNAGASGLTAGEWVLNQEEKTFFLNFLQPF